MSLESTPVLYPEYARSRSLDGPFRVVALGGGTGLPATLSGLKQVLFAPATAASRDRLTAIVTVGDDGGSSGRLRRLYGVLPPGDIRNCLLAVSDGEASLKSLFDFRFSGPGDIGGHSLGNLILTAFNLMGSDLGHAVEQAGEMLRACGQVLPSSTELITLRAHFTDGTSVDGESQIAKTRRMIERLSILPADAAANPLALDAIARADLIVIGPGSLYTSIIPILLISDIADAIERSRARVAVVSNIMTEPGETDHYTAADLLRAIQDHAPGVPIHDLLVNTSPITADTLVRYAAGGSSPILVDPDELRPLGCRLIPRDLLAAGPKIRHEPLKLGRALLDIAHDVRRDAELDAIHA